MSTHCFECGVALQELDPVRTWLEEGHDHGLHRVFVHADCRASAAVALAAHIVLPAVRIAAGLVNAGAKARAA